MIGEHPLYTPRHFVGTSDERPAERGRTPPPTKARGERRCALIRASMRAPAEERPAEKNRGAEVPEAEVPGGENRMGRPGGRRG